MAGVRNLLYIGQIRSHADAYSKMRLLLACRSHCIANFSLQQSMSKTLAVVEVI